MVIVTYQPLLTKPWEQLCWLGTLFVIIWPLHIYFNSSFRECNMNIIFYRIPGSEVLCSSLFFRGSICTLITSWYSSSKVSIHDIEWNSFIPQFVSNFPSWSNSISFSDQFQCNKLRFITVYSAFPLWFYHKLLFTWGKINYPAVFVVILILISL